MTETETREIVSKVASEALSEAVKTIQAVAWSESEKIAAKVRSLVETSRIALPANLLEILRDGGNIVSDTIELGDHLTQIQIYVEGRSYPAWPSECKVKGPGKFHATLIIEKVKE